MKHAVVFGGCIYFLMVLVYPVLVDMHDCTIWNVLNIFEGIQKRAS